jgi:hypothetical protein
MIFSTVITSVLTFIASDAFKYLVKSSAILGIARYFKSYFPNITWSSIILLSLAFGWTMSIFWVLFSFLGDIIYGKKKALLS